MTIYTLRSGGTAHPETSVLQMVTDFISEQGVKDLSTHYKVQEKSTPDLSVDVLAGRCFLQYTTSNAYPVRSTSNENLPVTANASGNPRIDTVVLYVDLSASANADASNVAKLEIVEGTPSASPNPPDDTAVGLQIGSANPFMRLGDVAVASGATTILNANITDLRQLFTYNTQILQILEQGSAPSTPDTGKTIIYSKTDGKVYSKDDNGIERIMGDEDWIDLSDSATINIDLSLGKKYRVTVAGNRTFTLSNIKDGKTFILRIKQDGTGSRLATFWANLYWAGNTAPTLSTTPAHADEFGFNAISASNTEGFIVGMDMLI